MKLLIILLLSLFMFFAININAQIKLKTLKFDDDSVTAIHYLPEGLHLISSSFHRNIILWNIETGKQIWNHNFDDIINKDDYFVSEIFAMEISPDGSKIAAAITKSRIINDRLTNERNEKVFILDAKNGQIISEINDGTRPLSFSPDGKILAVGTKNNLVKLLSLEKLKGSKIIGEETETANRRKVLLDFSSDNSFLALSNDERSRDKKFETFIVINAKIGDTVFKDTSFANIYELAFSHDGKQLTVVGKRFVNGQLVETIAFFDTSTWKQIKEITGYSANNLTFSPNGKFITFFESGLNYGEIYLLDATSYTKLYSFRLDSKPTTIGFSPDGKQLAIGTEVGKIILFKI